MARPTNADAAGTRRRILETATQRFADEGPKASLRTIAQSAGVSLATVHHYFGSKAGLRRSVIERSDEALAELSAELAAIARAGADLDAVVAEIVRRTYRFARAHELAIRLTARSAIDRGNIGPDRQAKVLLPGLELAAKLLAERIAADPITLRLVVRSVSYLVVRYALTDPAEIAIVLGQDLGGDEVAREQAVEDHLVFVAGALLEKAAAS